MTFKMVARSLGPLGLLLVVLAPLVLVGCSTLGIAETKDTEALDSRLTSQTRQNATNIQQTQNQVAGMDTTVARLARNDAQTQARLDSLSANFAAANEWLKQFNIDTIAEDAEAATHRAQAADARTQAISRYFLDKARLDSENLLRQIQEFQAFLDSLERAAPQGAVDIEITSPGTPGDDGP
jgi:chromosome segregation ATPase